MRALAIDYGEKRIGLALTDEEMITAQAYGTLENRGTGEFTDALRDIIHKEEVETVVIGKPISMKGVDTDQTRIVEEVAQHLEKELNRDIIRIDERLTSREAEAAGATKTNIDEKSAQLILQSYLEQR
ncbi:Holliday junction resolvase RuvX [Patescibacteria group bacterium]